MSSFLSNNKSKVSLFSASSLRRKFRLKNPRIIFPSLLLVKRSVWRGQSLFWVKPVEVKKSYQSDS